MNDAAISAGAAFADPMLQKPTTSAPHLPPAHDRPAAQDPRALSQALKAYGFGQDHCGFPSFSFDDVQEPDADASWDTFVTRNQPNKLHARGSLTPPEFVQEQAEWLKGGGPGRLLARVKGERDRGAAMIRRHEGSRLP